MTPTGPRLFLGLLPAPEVRDEIAERARSLLGPSLARVYAAEDLHLTLVFLGRIPCENVRRIEVGMQAAFEGAAPIRLRVGGTGSFPTAGHERALWAGLDLAPPGRMRLEDLVDRGRRLATAAGIQIGARDLAQSFVPHLTLAGPRAGESVPPAFEGLRFDLDWVAEEVLLFESLGATAPDGRYPVRARVHLRGG
ncbi:MAG: RNA 2',3'-cyclic phosphodiesterase [Planctomycetota bacterium]|nr:RNA 2',3'-cyclic phosphodiesterase [Planctomycetota bacterium]